MKDSHRVVMLDIDGCLADFIGAYTKLGASMFPDVIKQQRTEDRTQWYELNVKYDDEVWSYIKASPTWWTTLRPLVSQDVMNRVSRLTQTDDVYFVTARVGRNLKWQTEQWLRDQDVPDPTVIITTDKGECASVLAATYCLDDKAGNAVAVTYLSKNTASYILDRKYNQLDPAVIGSKVRRVKSVNEFLDDVDGSLAK